MGCFRPVNWQNSARPSQLYHLILLSGNWLSQDKRLPEVAHSLLRHLQLKVCLCGKQVMSSQQVLSRCTGSKQRKDTLCASPATIKFSPHKDGKKPRNSLMVIRFICLIMKASSELQAAQTWEKS